MGVTKIIAGLGNPGNRYAGTRHNVGFMLLDRLCSDSDRDIWRVTSGMWKEKFSGLSLEASYNGEGVLLLKPMQYMNRSGGSIAEALSFYKLELSDLIVVHDDIDLEFGDVRIKLGGGDGGHNGLRSVVSSVSGKDFYRIRLGVGRPAVVVSVEGITAEQECSKQEEVVDWVLKRFNEAETPVLNSLLEKGVGALTSLLLDGMQTAQNRYH